MSLSLAMKRDLETVMNPERRNDDPPGTFPIVKHEFNTVIHHFFSIVFSCILPMNFQIEWLMKRIQDGKLIRFRQSTRLSDH